MTQIFGFRCRGMSGQLTDRLFEQRLQNGSTFASDLAALNIQRGRDHGLPPYFKFRKALKTGRDLHSFSDLRDTHSRTNILKLSKA